MANKEGTYGRVRQLVGDGEAVWVSWPDLKHLRLMPGDIERAIATFKEKLGVEVKAIRLNPQNEELASEIPDGIQVDYSLSVLLWEAWLSAKPRDGSG